MGHEHNGDGEKLMVDKLNEENISLNYFFNIDGIGHKFIQDQISFYNINNALESEILQLQKTMAYLKDLNGLKGYMGFMLSME